MLHIIQKTIFCQNLISSFNRPDLFKTRTLPKFRIFNILEKRMKMIIYVLFSLLGKYFMGCLLTVIIYLLSYCLLTGIQFILRKTKNRIFNIIFSDFNHEPFLEHIVSFSIWIFYINTHNQRRTWKSSIKIWKKYNHL